MTDNGREFENRLIKEWAKENKMKLKNAIPYYHKSNGRVERVNRTLRTALSKTDGSVKTKLKRIIERYNITYHRGIGMCQKEALLEENFIKVKEHEEKYLGEFIKKKKINASLKLAQKF